MKEKPKKLSKSLQAINDKIKGHNLATNRASIEIQVAIQTVKAKYGRFS